MTVVARRKIVDFDTKCSKCHDGQLHDGREIPRLALHGGNRNEEPKLCVICHGPNQTDILYRTTASPPSTEPLITSTFNGVAPEVSVDFKRMPHAIHAGGLRGPYSVVGFNGTVVDFSGVRFPAKLSNCLNCHVEVNGKGTFELPLAPGVLGSTVKTGSTIGVTVNGQVGNLVDLDPTNNLRITPIASVCSSCHDKSEVRSHIYVVNVCATILGVTLPTLGIMLLTASICILIFDKQFGWFQKEERRWTQILPLP